MNVGRNWTKINIQHSSVWFLKNSRHWGRVDPTTASVHAQVFFIKVNFIVQYEQDVAVLYWLAAVLLCTSTVQGEGRCYFSRSCVEKETCAMVYVIGVLHIHTHTHTQLWHAGQGLWISFHIKSTIWAPFSMIYFRTVPAPSVCQLLSLVPLAVLLHLFLLFTLYTINSRYF